MSSISHAPEVFRISVPTRNFTMVSNTFCRSKLSPRAKAVALYLLSMRDGYTVRQADIASSIDMGLTTVKAALADLEQAGYLRRRTVREAGRVAGTDMAITDEPEALEPDSDPSTGAGFRPSLEPDSGYKLEPESGSLKKTHYKKTKKKTPPGDDAAAPPGELPLDLPTTTEPERQDPGTVVAAYVEAFTARTGSRPLGSDLAKIGAQAKRMVTDPAVEMDRLRDAARRLGQGRFTDLATEYRATYGEQARSGGSLGRRQTYFPANDAAVIAEIQARREAGETAGIASHDFTANPVF